MLKSLYTLLPANLFNRASSLLLWEAPSYASINARRLFVHKYPPLSIARYSFIQLSDLESCRVKTTYTTFDTAAYDSNLGSLRRESEALATAPLRHCATAPLRHCATAPLRHCATAPLRHCATAPLRHCATAPLRHCATAPLRHCATAPLRHCATAPLQSLIEDRIDTHSSLLWLYISQAEV